MWQIYCILQYYFPINLSIQCWKYMFVFHQSVNVFWSGTMLYIHLGVLDLHTCLSATWGPRIDVNDKYTGWDRLMRPSWSIQVCVCEDLYIHPCHAPLAETTGLINARVMTWDKIYAHQCCLHNDEFINKMWIVSLFLR